MMQQVFVLRQKVLGCRLRIIRAKTGGDFWTLQECGCKLADGFRPHRNVCVQEQQDLALCLSRSQVARRRRPPHSHLDLGHAKSMRVGNRR